MEAIILAGGFGTRLQSVVKDVPKPMALVGEKPFLEHIFAHLQKNGVKNVVLGVSYKKEVIQNHFKNKFLGINIVYSEECEPLGTGGAIKQALSFAKNNEVFIINGDTFFDIDLSKMSLVDSVIQIALKPMENFERYGSVLLDSNNKITQFCEKKYTKNGLINGGIYLLKRDIFDDFHLDKKFSFEEFLQNNLEKLKPSGMVFDDYFIDIGVPSDYFKANEYFKIFKLQQ